MRYNQAGFIPGPKSWFTRLINVTYYQYICRIKDKIRLIISIDAEKEFDKIQHLPRYKHPKQRHRSGLAQPNKGRL